MSARDWIARWTHGEDWRTWIAHAALALLIALPLALLWDPTIGAAVAVGFYLIRELDQILYMVVDRRPLHPFDHFMDVAAPAVIVIPAALLVRVLL